MVAIQITNIDTSGMLQTMCTCGRVRQTTRAVPRPYRSSLITRRRRLYFSKEPPDDTGNVRQPASETRPFGETTVEQKE